MIELAGIESNLARHLRQSDARSLDYLKCLQEISTFPAVSTSLTGEEVMI